MQTCIVDWTFQSTEMCFSGRPKQRGAATLAAATGFAVVIVGISSDV